MGQENALLGRRASVKAMQCVTPQVAAPGARGSQTGDSFEARGRRKKVVAICKYRVGQVLVG